MANALPQSELFCELYVLGIKDYARLRRMQGHTLCTNCDLHVIKFAHRLDSTLCTYQSSLDCESRSNPPECIVAEFDCGASHAALVTVARCTTKCRPAPTRTVGPLTRDCDRQTLPPCSWKQLLRDESLCGLIRFAARTRPSRESPQLVPFLFAPNC